MDKSAAELMVAAWWFIFLPCSHGSLWMKQMAETNGTGQSFPQGPIPLQPTGLHLFSEHILGSVIYSRMTYDHPGSTRVKNSSRCSIG